MKIDYNFPWKTQPLSTLITESISGVSLNDNDFSDAGFPVAHKGDVRPSGVLDLSARNSRYVRKESFELNKRAQVTKDHLVVSLRDLVPTAPQLGLINQLPEDHACVLLAQGTYGFKVDPSVLDKTFLSQLSAVDLFRSTMKKNAVGSTQKHMRSTEFFELEIPIPPLKEQEKIAKILSTWDEAIEKLSELKLKKEILANGYSEDIFKSSKIIFEQIPICELGEVVSGGTPKTDDPTLWNGNIAWVTPTDITKLKTKYIRATARTITDKGLKESSAKLIPAGSIVVCTRATIGALAIAEIPLATNQGFKNIIPKEKIDALFLYYAIKRQTNELIKKAAGSTFLEISKSDFEIIRLSVPKLEEQKKIGNALDLMDREIEAIQKNIDAITLQKQGLMQQLFTGKKRVKV